MSQNAVVIGALRVNYFWYSDPYFSTDLQISMFKRGKDKGHDVCYYILKDFRNTPVIYSLSLPHG